MRSATVKRGDSRILSILYEVYSYTGGAHGQAMDRACVFDVGTGKLLTIDDLFGDREAMEQAMLKKMMDLIRTDVRYQTIQDYMTAFRPDDELEDVLLTLIREGSWVLDEQDQLKDRLNTGHVRLYPVSEDQADELSRLLAMHEKATGSPRAREILDHFSDYLPKFKTVISDEYLSRIR